MRKSCLFLSLLFLVLCIGSKKSIQSKYRRNLPPVILVPGDGGTQLFARLHKSSVRREVCWKKTNKYFNLWLNVGELAPYIIDCFVDNMKLMYNKTSHTTYNNGVDIQIRGWGDTETVEWLDPSQFSVTSYFYEIVNAMVEWGYKRGSSVRGAPFDFRKAPNEMKEFFVKLKKLVEETYVLNNNTRVALLAHSMGNPVTLYFLNKLPQAWKDKYIDSFVALAGVWGGAIKPLRLYTSGDNLNIWVVNPLTVRREQRSMPSTAWLIPSDKFWTKDEILISRPGRNYTVNDYNQLFTDLNYTNGHYMREDTKDLIRDLTPPGVTVHCLHGLGIDTPGSLKFSSKTWPNDQPQVITDDGDGTVNKRSLEGCLRWVGKQKKPVIHKIFKKAEHMEILTNTEIFDYLKSVLVR